MHVVIMEKNMEKFNTMLSGLLGKGTPDTDTNTGDYGEHSTEGQGLGQGNGGEPQHNNKIVLNLESGMEIHIPMCICKRILEAMPEDISIDVGSDESDESNDSNESEDNDNEDSEDSGTELDGNDKKDED